LALIQNLAQKPTLAPLHHHVHARAFLVAEYTHDLGVVQLLANTRLAFEAVEENGVRFQIGMRNLQGNRLVVAQVCCAVD